MSKAVQISMLPQLQEGEDADDIAIQAKLFAEYGKKKRKWEDKKKRKWEDAFQKWSNSQWDDDYTPFGKCGYGSMCDWCKDNSYGRPCVRALNAMCREKQIQIDYNDFDFTKVW